MKVRKQKSLLIQQVIQRVAALSTAGSWSSMIFRAPSKWNHSMIQWHRWDADREKLQEQQHFLACSLSNAVPVSQRWLEHSFLVCLWDGREKSSGSLNTANLGLTQSSFPLQITHHLKGNTSYQTPGGRSLSCYSFGTNDGMLSNHLHVLAPGKTDLQSPSLLRSITLVLLLSFGTSTVIFASSNAISNDSEVQFS